MLHNVVFLCITLGALLGATGVGGWLLASPVGPIVRDTVRFIAAPTSALILIIVGYELRFERALMSPVLKTVGLRLLVMWTLMALSALVVFSVIPFDKPVFVAMLLAFSMPAPFIIPLYADVTGHADYISTTLSVQTLLSIALFIVISVYTLA
jgi:hypothetical protein